MTRLVEVICYQCKRPFGMTEAHNEAALAGREKISFYCPYGHSQHYLTGPSEAEKLRKQLETQKQQNAMWRDDAEAQRQRAEAAERSASAQRGVVTRLKNRAAAGVCPCCNRTFANLQRHMAGQHPTFRTEEVANLEPSQ